MILRPAGHGGVVSPLHFGEDRRKMPPWLVAAIGASIALHVAGAAWVYNQRFVLPAEEALPEAIDITIWQPPKPKPPVITEAPRKPQTTVPVRQPENVSVEAETAPIMATPDAKPGDGKPIISTQIEPVVTTGESEAPTPPVIRHPAWISKPTAAQMERVYPRRQLEDGIGGRVTLRCSVTVTGAMANCSVASETPAGAGFGAAAMKLTRHFRISPRTEDGRAVEGAVVTIPLVFSAGE